MAGNVKDWLEHLKPLGSRSKVSLGRGVYRELLEAIIKGKVKPSEHLVEQSLADQLGVSRILVREAIRELATDGLVDLVPHRGAFVSNFSLGDIEEIFSLRASLETLAVGLATHHIRRSDFASLEEILDEMGEVEQTGDRLMAASVDTEFHRALMKASRHTRAQQAWERMSAQITMVVYNTTTYYPAIDGLAQRHGVILEAIRSGDKQHAQVVIDGHIAVGREHLIEALKNSQDLAESQILVG